MENTVELSTSGRETNLVHIQQQINIFRSQKFDISVSEI